MIALRKMKTNTDKLYDAEVCIKASFDMIRDIGFPRDYKVSDIEEIRGMVSRIRARLGTYLENMEEPFEY